MSEKELAPYLLYHLQIDGAVVKFDIQEFHPGEEEIRVEVFEAEIELSGKINKPGDKEVRCLTPKEARSLYKRLVRRGYRISYETIDDFLASMLSTIENS